MSQDLLPCGLDARLPVPASKGMHVRRLPALGFLLCLLGAGGARAADFYISPAGSDANPGSLALPWKSFAYAVAQLKGGDTLNLRAGTYAERLILSGKTASVASPIVIRAYQGEAPVIDGTSLIVPSGGLIGLVTVQNCSHIHLEGLDIGNYKTIIANRIPVGIQIEGSGSGIKVSGCKVHHIWQSATSATSDGFGIAVYGTSATPIDGLVLENNEVFNLRTGQSESVVLNGNVTNFAVIGNHVHDCNNIGIDFIGYEESAPADFDRARNGICRGNLVHGIDSSFNPGYGGNFTTGGGERSAAGIYIDGGTNITVEGNRVYGCNFGIELASEHASGATDEIHLLNNLIHHNMGAGLIMGGYDANRGKTRLCEIRNNTLYLNDTLQTFGGQVAIQFYFEQNTFRNNIVWANPATRQMVVHYAEGGTASQRVFGQGNVFEDNIYFCQGAESEIQFGLNLTGEGPDAGNTAYTGLTAWRAAVGSDSRSSFHDPEFVVAAPAGSAQAGDFKLSASSFCRDRGEPSFVPPAGEEDYFGNSRLAGARVDVGFHELASGLNAWRAMYFGVADGSGTSGDDEDPDRDGVRNLIEYSQGMDPLHSDLQLAPSGVNEGEVFRFRYRKADASLSYQVQASDGTGPWTEVQAAEQTDGNGNYWRDLPYGPGKLFVRLSVSY
ncbi:right-handed parallel beta-helix repeat-containing protein [Luteolibacter luteus]|uniref:Right-handed parallel beta-helix repeat-containing protein n=1 Tax=Luteolibacter luteus TaxID=2728835 RepID=A0A858RJU7_9BACT|nr:right-handed parallel beta-helix repeat-containing protein [Luteolibacter luteus]QJE96748.1 right-handed parallel beta-helix repeat-containing protein [Luteolibacter luteus]